MVDGAAVRGLNDVPLAVTDPDRAIDFYRDVLGFRLNDTHAFDVDEADSASIAERVSVVSRLWQTNRSEGAALYFLDPDGHKLGLHGGSLGSRLGAYRAHPHADR